MAKKRPHKSIHSPKFNGSSESARLHGGGNGKASVDTGRIVQLPSNHESEPRSKHRGKPGAANGVNSVRARANDSVSKPSQALAVAGANNPKSDRPTGLLGELKGLGVRSGKAVANGYALLASALLEGLEKFEDASAERTLRRRVHARNSVSIPRSGDSLSSTATTQKSQAPQEKPFLPPK